MSCYSFKYHCAYGTKCAANCQKRQVAFRSPYGAICALTGVTLYPRIKDAGYYGSSYKTVKQHLPLGIHIALAVQSARLEENTMTELQEKLENLRGYL
jgi:hypothetical protein